MCVVSMIFDHYHDKWFPLVPLVPQYPLPQPAVTPEEVAEFRRLLDRAREYDRRNNEPDCELLEKKRKLKELADVLGVAIDFL